MPGLFLRYCPACNSTSPCAERDLKCAECGGPLKIVDAFALIPALGYKLDIGQRESANSGTFNGARPPKGLTKRKDGTRLRA